MNVLKAVSFDAFGTLIIPRIAVGQVYSDFLYQNCGINLHPKVIEKSFITTYKYYLKKWPNFGKVNGIQASFWWHNLVLDTYRGCMDNSSDIANLKQINQKNTFELFDWYTSKEAWSLRSGAQNCLISLQYQYELAILSNFDERLPAILKSLGLFHQFSIVAFSNQFDFMKPDKRMFHVILNGLQIDQPDQLLHIGDCPIRDYEAARRVGMLSLLLTQHKSTTALSLSDGVEVPLDHIVDDLESIKVTIDNIPLRQ